MNRYTVQAYRVPLCEAVCGIGVVKLLLCGLAYGRGIAKLLLCESAYATDFVDAGLKAWNSVLWGFVIRVR